MRTLVVRAMSFFGFVPLTSILYCSLDLINYHRDSYAEAQQLLGKWDITMAIVEAVLEDGRFLKPTTGEKTWTVIALEDARQKVAHAIQYQNRRRTTPTKRLREGPNGESSPRSVAHTVSPFDAVASFMPIDKVESIHQIINTNSDIRDRLLAQAQELHLNGFHQGADLDFDRPDYNRSVSDPGARFGLHPEDEQPLYHNLHDTKSSFVPEENQWESSDTFPTSQAEFLYDCNDDGDEDFAEAFHPGDYPKDKSSPNNYHMGGQQTLHDLVQMHAHQFAVGSNQLDLEIAMAVKRKQAFQRRMSMPGFQRSPQNLFSLGLERAPRLEEYSDFHFAPDLMSLQGNDDARARQLYINQLRGSLVMDRERALIDCMSCTSPEQQHRRYTMPSNGRATSPRSTMPVHRNKLSLESFSSTSGEGMMNLLEQCEMRMRDIHQDTEEDSVGLQLSETCSQEQQFDDGRDQPNAMQFQASKAHAKFLFRSSSANNGKQEGFTSHGSFDNKQNESYVCNVRASSPNASSMLTLRQKVLHQVGAKDCAKFDGCACDDDNNKWYAADSLQLMRESV